VGTSTLIYKLEVSGNGDNLTSGSIRVTNSLDGTGAGAIVGVRADTGANSASGYFGAFGASYGSSFFANRVAMAANSDAEGITLIAGNSGQDIRFVTGVPVIERVRIDTAGKVGIGVTSPGTLLHLVGASAELRVAGSATNQHLQQTFYDNNATLKGRLIYAGANAAGVQYTGLLNDAGDYLALSSAGNTTIRMSTNGTERMRVDGSGLVGIGTNSPGTRLDVVAGGTPDAVTDANMRLVSSNASADNNLLSVQSGATGTAGIAFGDNSDGDRGSVKYKNASGDTGEYLTLNVAGERVRIQQDGNVGIGTASGINSKLTFPAATDAAGGILFGSDTNLYRSAADTLKTDDRLVAVGGFESSQATLLSGVLTQTLSASPTDDFDPGTATVLRIDPGSAAGGITGFSGGVAGRLLLVCNVSTTAGKDITLSHQAGSSTAANRIIGANLNSVDIRPGGSCLLWYDSDTSRWRCVAI
jgi:hypothetical protein